MLKARRASTLVELTVSLVISALVLGMIVVLEVRQERLYAGLGHRLGAQEQLRHAASMLPVDLRTASASSGDLIAGEARDTAFELRATIGTAVVCGTSASAIVLTPAEADPGLVSWVADPQPGDTAWVLADDRAEATWDGLAIRGVSRSSDACPFGFAPRASSGPRFPSKVLSTDDSAVARYPPGTPVRVTRRVRYSLYRSSDAQWYLGWRDWNAETGRFNQVQPVSGPYERPAGARALFRYFDASGAELVAPVADTRGVALVQIALRSRGSPLFGHAPATASIESSTVAVALRNRR